MCCCNHHCHGCRNCYPQLNTTIRCWRCGTRYYPGFWHVCPSVCTPIWTTTVTSTSAGSTTRLANTVARLAG